MDAGLNAWIHAAKSGQVEGISLKVNIETIATSGGIAESSALRRIVRVQLGIVHVARSLDRAKETSIVPHESVRGRSIVSRGIQSRVREESLNVADRGYVIVAKRWHGRTSSCGNGNVGEYARKVRIRKVGHVHSWRGWSGSALGHIDLVMLVTFVALVLVLVRLGGESRRRADGRHIRDNGADTGIRIRRGDRTRGGDRKDGSGVYIARDDGRGMCIRIVFLATMVAMLLSRHRASQGQHSQSGDSELHLYRLTI